MQANTSSLFSTYHGDFLKVTRTYHEIGSDEPDYFPPILHISPSPFEAARSPTERAFLNLGFGLDSFEPVGDAEPHENPTVYPPPMSQGTPRVTRPAIKSYDKKTPKGYHCVAQVSFILLEKTALFFYKAEAAAFFHQILELLALHMRNSIDERPSKRKKQEKEKCRQS